MAPGNPLVSRGEVFPSCCFLHHPDTSCLELQPTWLSWQLSSVYFPPFLLSMKHLQAGEALRRMPLPWYPGTSCPLCLVWSLGAESPLAGQRSFLSIFQLSTTLAGMICCFAEILAPSANNLTITLLPKEHSSLRGSSGLLYLLFQDKDALPLLWRQHGYLVCCQLENLHDKRSLGRDGENQASKGTSIKKN